MKACPYCQEQIRDDAVRCAHCSSWLESHADRSTSANHRVVYVLDRGIVRFGKFAIAVLALFLIVGAFFYGFDLKQASKEINQVKDRTLELEKELVSERDKVIALKEDAERLQRELVEEREVVARLKGEMVEQAIATKKHYEEVVGYRSQARSIVASLPSGSLDEVQVETIVKRVLVRDLGDTLSPDLLRQYAELASPRGGSLVELRQQNALQVINLTPGTVDISRLSSVKVAVLSEHFSSDLPTLEPYLLSGKDLLTVDAPEEYNRYPVKDHFTGIASLIAAVAPETKILPIRVMSPSGGFGILSDIVAGLDFAVAENARVIVLPFGAGAAAGVYEGLVKRALERDILVVAPAGNMASADKVYPAATPGVLSVAATDPEDRLAAFSSYGDWVSVAAPGERITIVSDEGKLTLTSGGSFSTAIAAGAAALLMSINPDVGASQVKSILMRTAAPLATLAGAPAKSIGGGRIDLVAAIAMLESMSSDEIRRRRDGTSEPGPIAGGVSVRGEVSERRPIPDHDPSGLSSAISIDSPGIIRDVEVTVDITHTWVGDVKLVLRSPGGEKITLRDRAGGPGNAIVDTYTVDRVADLQKVIGTPARGDWTLIVTDHGVRDVGELIGWTIRFAVDSAPS